MKEIIKKYRSKEISNETDEKYAGGFWDKADDIAGSFVNRIMEAGDIDDLQESVYYALTELYREMEKIIESR